MGLTMKPIAYWPMEDGSDSTRPGSAIPGVWSMTPLVATPTMASFADFDASKPILNINGAQLVGNIPMYTPSDSQEIRFITYVTPGSEPPDGQTLIELEFSGAIGLCQIIYHTGGALRVKVLRLDGTTAVDTVIAFAMLDKLTLLGFSFVQNGSSVDFTLRTMEQGASSGVSAAYTATSCTYGRLTRITVSPNGGISTFAIGHLHLRNEVAYMYDMNDEFLAWRGEHASDRIRRLCVEEGIPLQLIGQPNRSVTMGAQSPLTLTALLRECESADMGVMYESRLSSSLAYRSRASMMNQEPALTIGYSAHELSAPLDPVEDDQSLRNDVSVTRTNGSTARSIVTSGPLASAAPPDGPGVYADSVTVNVSSDDRLEDQAGWRSHVGTMDEARYSKIEANLSNNAIVANPVAALAVTKVDIGDLIRIDDMPAGLPPDDVDAICQGYAETLNAFTHTFEWNASPGGAWTTGQWDVAASRYDTAGTTLTAGVTSTATTMSLTTTSGPTWSTTAVPYDVVISGERVTVTAVAGTTSPQTATVARSVNGVVKAQTAGADVRLWKRSYYSF